jgi:uncharacterized membrane protein YdfJ with MMPL/SSD domain
VAALARDCRERLGFAIACQGIVTQIVSRPWDLAVVAALVLLVLLLTVAGLIGAYVADEYMTPAFSEHSVPPPRPY